MKNAFLSVKPKSNNSSTFNISNEKKFSRYFATPKYLLSHKSFIEELLNIIKFSQLDFLTKILTENKNMQSPQNLNKIPNKLTKSFLVSLKNKLRLIKKEKMIEFNINIDEKNKNSKKFFEYKKFNKTQQDINQLKMLNFQYENEIKKIDNVIKLRKKHLYLFKSYDCFLEIFDEHFCRSINNYEDINKLYIQNIINENNNLLIIEKEIIKERKKIEELKKEIKILKNKTNIVNEKNKIAIDDIITENRNEYIKSNENRDNHKPLKNKKVNFQNVINNNCNHKYNININIKNKYINIIDTTKKYKNRGYNNNIKFNKKRYSYTDKKHFQNLKIHSSFFLKNNIKSSLFFNNKSIDNERTTISSLNDKVMEKENILNNTI